MLLLLQRVCKSTKMSHLKIHQIRDRRRVERENYRDRWGLMEGIVFLPAFLVKAKTSAMHYKMSSTGRLHPPILQGMSSKLLVA